MFQRDSGLVRVQSWVLESWGGRCLQWGSKTPRGSEFKILEVFQLYKFLFFSAEKCIINSKQTSHKTHIQVGEHSLIQAIPLLWSPHQLNFLPLNVVHICATIYYQYFWTVKSVCHTELCNSELSCVEWLAQRNISGGKRCATDSDMWQRRMSTATTPMTLSLKESFCISWHLTVSAQRSQQHGPISLSPTPT